MPLTSQLRTSEHQTSFNFKRWRELLSDSEIARLPYRLHGVSLRHHFPLNAENAMGDYKGRRNSIIGEPTLTKERMTG